MNSQPFRCLLGAFVVVSITGCDAIKGKNEPLRPEMTNCYWVSPPQSRTIDYGSPYRRCRKECPDGYELKGAWCYLK